MPLSETPPPKLYAAREPVFPRRVKGAFRTLKWWIMGICLGIYYITPWLRWDRGVDLPDQAVLVDLTGRRFFFFMIEIWPHEFYFVAGLLIMAGLGLFLFTSALGRVWCGYACPQTVWTDLFIWVERLVEGDRNARIRLQRQAWNGEKLRKRAIKWSLWVLIGLATGGAWVFYFTDAPTLWLQLWHFQAPPIAYITMAILTATTFVFGGFAREQICIYACPWPRIQAAMMDEDTITIAYREWRGEPRGHLRREPEPQASPTQETVVRQGDCIDCKACVNVCPMGIDIRDGQQLACITCGLCIDACNDMMHKIGKPPNLIGYLALTDETLERAGQPVRNVWRHIFRPRVVLYTLLWAGIGVAMVVALFNRVPLDVSVTPVRNPIYVLLSDGSIRNTYDLRLRNQFGEAREFAFSAEGVGPLMLRIEGSDNNRIQVPADTTELVRLYLTAPPESAARLQTRSDVEIQIETAAPNLPISSDTVRQISTTTVFNGKGE